MSARDNEWIAWIMLCVGLTSFTSSIHMEATVTEKNMCFIALRCMQHVTWYRGLLLNLVAFFFFRTSTAHLCPRRANINGSAQFPSEDPKKRLTQSLHLTSGWPGGYRPGAAGTLRGEVGGVISLFSCALTIPVGLCACSSCAADLTEREK